MSEGETLSEMQMDNLMAWICESLKMPGILLTETDDGVVETRLYEDFDCDATCFMSDWRLGVLRDAQRLDDATADALLRIRHQWEDLSRQWQHRTIQEHRESDEWRAFVSTCESLAQRFCARGE